MRFRIPKDERNGANRQPKRAFNQGDVDTAIEQLDQLLQDTSVEKEKDTLYYLRGNAYRKKGDWKQALDNYQFAMISIRKVLPFRQEKW